MATMMSDKEVEMEEGIASGGNGEEDQAQWLLEQFEPPKTPVEKTIRRWLLGLWNRNRSEIWLVFNVIATLMARKLFRWSFPYPLCFTFMVQAISNTIFSFWSIQTIIRGFRETRWRSKEWRFGISTPRAILHSLRLLLSAVISGLGMLFGTQALAIYPNFHTLALLPVFTYVCDSVLLHIFSIVRLHPFQKLSAYFNFVCVLLVTGCCLGIIAADYRIEIQLVPIALMGSFLESLSRNLLMLYSNVQEERRESTSFFIFERSMIGVTQLIVVATAALKNENTTAAVHTVTSWGFFSTLKITSPAVLLLLAFSSGINAAYRGPMEEELISVLEDAKPQGKSTLQATLHASYLMLAISAFRREYTMLHWLQSLFFALLYVIALGPVHVGYYPLRLQNWFAHLIRRKPRHLSLKAWSLFGYLVGCTIIAWVLLTCIPVYWTNTLAYNYSAKTFLNPAKATIDYTYHPPRIRGMEVIVAHSHDHSHKSLFEMLDRIRESEEIMGMTPTVKVYTKDARLLPTLDDRKKTRNHIAELPNIGGQAATFLYYIVENWDQLPSQVVFLASTKEGTFDKRINDKIRENYASQGSPIADADPKTGFLNLGESQVCQCNGCSDSYGWEDTFGLVPSMWTAARPSQTDCDSVLLTYGNNFIASAARIRGTKKDVWETLLRALTRNDTQNSWAHDPEKLPKMLMGEELKGRWGPGGVYEVVDSKVEPVLGRTMERLWGVLLQCSTPEIAWRCPNLEAGPRIGGNGTACGCIDDLAMGFL